MSMSDVAMKFFEACETGKGWEGCKAYCHPNATFVAQAEPLADVKTLEIEYGLFREDDPNHRAFFSVTAGGATHTGGWMFHRGQGSVSGGLDYPCPEIRDDL